LRPPVVTAFPVIELSSNVPVKAWSPTFTVKIEPTMVTALSAAGVLPENNDDIVPAGRSPSVNVIVMG
jgi:hypothetical protein